MNPHRYQVVPPQYHAAIPVRGRKQTEIRARSGVGVRDHGSGHSVLPRVCYAHAIAITLAGLMELVCSSIVYLYRQRPSRCDGQVGSCICSFGTGTRFTRVRGLDARPVTKRPSTSKAPTARCIPCRFDGYRVERTSSRAGPTPAEGFGIVSKGRSSGFHGARLRQQSALPAMLLGAVSAGTSREGEVKRRRRNTITGAQG
jgi:hypothetical protein